MERERGGREGAFKYKERKLRIYLTMRKKSTFVQILLADYFNWVLKV